MSVHDAEIGDVYADEHGKLWRVVALFREPTVRVQEIEKIGDYPVPVSKFGGVSGYMWTGFKRIHRPAPLAPKTEDSE